MYATNLTEIDKTPYQIVYHSRGNPRPPCVVVHEARDEGYHSAFVYTTCKRSLVKLEESYRQQASLGNLTVLSLVGQSKWTDDITMLY